MEVEFIHKQNGLYFYRYSDSNRVYVSNSKNNEDITAEEFGFINEKRDQFKLTEDIYLTKEWLEAILFMMNWKGL